MASWADIALPGSRTGRETGESSDSDARCGLGRVRVGPGSIWWVWGLWSPGFVPMEVNQFNKSQSESWARP